MKKRIILLLCISTLILLTITIYINKEKIIKTTKALFGLETKEITYEIYSNQNGKIKLTLTATDTENGIAELELPDGDKLISSSSRNKIATDYTIENDGTYTFTSKSTSGETMTKTIEVNEEFRNNLIGIEKVQEISTEQDYKVIKKFDGENSYKYYYAIGENNDNWIELPDYQIVNLDKYKVKENNWTDAEGNVILKLKKVSESGRNEVEVHKTLSGISIPDNLYNEEEQILEGDSIISCIRDNTIKSGNYRLKVNGEEYPAEIYNYDEDVNYITDKNLGTSEEDSRMLIVKYNGNLNIDTDRLITAQTRKKGMFIYVAGELTNSGNISMTARGAKAKGQDVYLLKHDNGIYEYVPAIGAEGGPSANVHVLNYAGNSASKSQNGNNGENGNERATAGGGSGFASANLIHGGDRTAISGSGSYGTSYSGGTGGGSSINGYKWNGFGYTELFYEGKSGESNGGSGGNGYYGGTGNPGGIQNGTTGTGGLLILYANKLNNSGKLQSNGVNANEYGGASGGGSVNIFYNQLENKGTIEANGGIGQNGGNGGNGTITLYNLLIGNLNITVDEITQNSFRVIINNSEIKATNITYDYLIDSNKEKKGITESSINIDNLQSAKTYQVQVILHYGNEEYYSNTIFAKTLRNDGLIEKVLDYPIMTSEGMKNIKCYNPNNEDDYHYELDLSKDCTAEDALDKAAYDGDDSTYYDGTSPKCKFYYASYTKPYQTCLKIDPNFKGTIITFLSINGYWKVPDDGKFLNNNIFHITYYSKGYSWNSDLLLKITGKLYEIYYDKTIQ